MEKYDDWNLTQPSDMGTVGKCPLCKAIVEMNDIETHIQYHVDNTDVTNSIVSSFQLMGSMFGLQIDVEK